MEMNQYIELIKSSEINDDLVKKFEDHYGTTLPESVRHIVSVSLDDFFLGEKCRILSVKEILDTETFTGIDFTNLNMFPLADCRDDDYIVYNFETGKFEMYNIYDEVSFREYENMEELLLTLN